MVRGCIYLKTSLGAALVDDGQRFGQRMLAAGSEYVDLNDELDHLGLYIAQNNYSRHAADLMRGKFDRLNFDGFHEPIDEYFSTLAHGETPVPPHQTIPNRLDEILRFLAASNNPKRSELACFLLDGDEDFRTAVTKSIETAMRENGVLHRARPLSFYGEMAMTLYVWSPAAPRSVDAAQRHGRAVMAANKEKSRPLIELEYDAANILTGVHMQHLGLAGLGMAEMALIKSEAATLKRRRLENAMAQGGIGRNERCPCGSERKFKKCHGAN